MKVNRWLVAVLVVVGLLFLWDWFGSKHGGDGMSDSTAALADSLDTTHVAHEDTVSVLAAAETIYVTRGAASAASASESRRASEEVRRLADSLAATAETADEWRLAHDTRKREADSLRSEANKWQNAYVDADSARQVASTRADKEQERREALERLERRLRADLAEASKTRWTDRISVTLGYGTTAERSGSVVHGPSLTAGYRVWPRR